MKTRNYQFILPTTIFYPGQVLQGQVKFEVVEELKVKNVRVECKGDCVVHWTERHNKRTVHYRNEEHYYHFQTFCLQGGGEELLSLQPGFYEYPFSFQLPVNLPTSFEIHQAKVRHRLVLVVDGMYFKEVESENPFTVLSILDLNLMPQARQRTSGQDEKTVCCLCCASGPIKGSMEFDRTGYVPGEAITIHSGSCENNSSRNCDIVQLDLVMNVWCTARKVRNFPKIVATMSLPQIPEKESQTINGYRIAIPALPPSSLIGCNIIDIQYTLDYVIKPNGPALQLRVPVPILLGSVPLRDIAQSYGAPPPLPVSAPAPILTAATTGDAPKVVMPADIPPPSYASCAFGSMFDDTETGQNSVHPDPSANDNTWKPAYAYYNWN